MLTLLPRDATLTPVRALIRTPTVTSVAETSTVASAVTATTVAGTAVCQGTINEVDALLGATARKRADSTYSLETVFRPPDSCLTDLYDISGSQTLTAAPTEIPECYPNGIYTIFSPGLCPSGYIVGLLSTQIFTGTNCQNATTTNCICCPS